MKIKELDKFNGSYHDSFCAIYSMVGYETEQLYKRYHSDAINDIKSYQSRILYKTVKTIYTLYKVISDLQDYNSAGALIRVIADTLSSYNLIYHENDEETKMLRHYLYILDGLSDREKLFSKQKPKYDDNISVDDYNALLYKIANTYDNTIKGIDFCKEQISHLELYKKNCECVKTLINNRNWKFYGFDNTTKRYNWPEMYKKLFVNETVADAFVFLSQYVHGLSISNLITELDDIELYEPYYSYGIVMLGKVRNFIETDFGMSRKELINGFEKSEFCKDYILCLSEIEKRKILEMFSNSKR